MKVFLLTEIEAIQLDTCDGREPNLGYVVLKCRKQVLAQEDE